MLASDAALARGRDDTLPLTLERDTSRDEFVARIGMKQAALRALVSDLAARREVIYWRDLALTCVVAYGAFWLALGAVAEPWREGAWLALCACAVYRMTLFTHELSHIPEREFRAFRVAWNLVCGLPLLVPSFLYEVHGAHHDRRSYASIDDGEYRAFALAPRVEALGSVIATVFAVPTLVLRFLVLAPLSWLVPPLRRFVLSKMSALVIDFSYSRPLPAKRPVRWLLQEAACCAWCALLVALTITGRLSPHVLLCGYVVLSGAVFLNSLRVLCAHRYRSTGEPSSFLEQVLDSNNFPEGLAFFWAPLGLRYHAVHHLLPTLPYHALGEAYRRIMKSLPENSAFRQTYRRSFLAGLDDVVGRRRANGSDACE